MDCKTFFQTYPKIALAFSGGVDSAFLLSEAIRQGADVHAYYVKTPFQPAFEWEDAKRLADALGAGLTVIHKDVLSDSVIASNPKDRCYYCKKFIFSSIAEQALADGYRVLIDGTNASDEEADRPGMRALKELKVLSPLKECGLSKNDIRRLSKERGLFTWDKPAYACLATRIPTMEPITVEKLKNTEQAEDFLRTLGFTDYRVRMAGTMAKIQMPAAQLPMLLEKRIEIINELKKYYQDIVLDLEARHE